MGRLFADTFFFIALLSERDAAHWDAVAEWATMNDGDTLTTAWVLVELADGMSRDTLSRATCAAFLSDIRAEKTIKLIEPDATLLWRGLELYTDRPDKEWSLTDCISFVVMHDEGITDALTGDHHFEQAGFVALLSSKRH